jgi:hypothetical protein
MMPEENLGIVVLTNSETPVSSILVNKAFDVFIGAPARDWSANYLELRKASDSSRQEAEKRHEQERARDTRPSLDPAGYAGAYTGQMYGDAKVAIEEGRLVLRLVPAPNFVGDLEHWQYDTFRVKWREGIVYPFPKGFVTFVINARGQVEEMKIDVPNPDFDFKELEFKRVQTAAR